MPKDLRDGLFERIERCAQVLGTDEPHAACLVATSLLITYARLAGISLDEVQKRTAEVWAVGEKRRGDA